MEGGGGLSAIIWSIVVGIVVDGETRWFRCRRQHSLAFQICDASKLRKEKVLVHWACEKVCASAKSCVTWRSSRSADSYPAVLPSSLCGAGPSEW